MKEDFRPKPELRTWFPYSSLFDRAYVIRFPKVATRKVTRRLQLRGQNAAFTGQVTWTT